MSYLNPSSSGLEFSTYGLADVCGEKAQMPLRAFCSGRCARYPNATVRNMGKAFMFSPHNNEKLLKTNECPNCGTAIFWSRKYNPILLIEREKQIKGDNDE